METRIQIFLKLSTVLRCQNRNLLCQCSVNLSFRQNQPRKYEILIVKFLGDGEKVEFSNFIGWFCLKDKFLEKKMDTSVSYHDSEGLWKISSKSESWFPIQLTQRWWNFPKLFMVLQCQNRKLVCQVFAQAIYLLAKTNLWNLKFWPFLPRFNQIGTIFPGLNWKPKFNFPQNFS